ncbi:MAG TPA: DUF58 domain-containing protein [Streptosporangiaceae bacterium]|jgi:uncharacterized protein (DUF58 family)|nr:DUF58 domain-containing protein [Streptosporangiaceae bacterium]
MRSWLAAFTTRGTSFLAAGFAAAIAGLFLGERDLISVGVLLILLPLFSALAAGRARYRLSCTRSISPPRVAAGQTAQVRLRLDNVSRLPTGLLLAEDTVPYALGTRPRYVLNGIERGGTRELSYPLRSDLRGKFEVGPLEIRIADAFGLVELGRSFSSRTTLVVTPKVVPLPRAVVSGSWLGDGDGRARTAAAAGEDDVVPRAYRDGDELRRVHWRSTARYGELMVRREEQQWRNRVLLLLDTRRAAHVGSGATSSFEFAVSAAASIGAHLAHEGLEGQLITDTGAVTAPGIFEDLLLNSLAVIKPSRSRELDAGIAALRGCTGLTIAVAGRLSAGAARQLAASRRDAGPAIAVLLAVSTWASGRDLGPAPDGGASGSEPGGAANGHAANGRPPEARVVPGHPANGQGLSSPSETDQAAGILRAAGWRVTCIDAGTPLAAAWQRLAASPGPPAPPALPPPAPPSASSAPSAPSATPAAAPAPVPSAGTMPGAAV